MNRKPTSIRPGDKTAIPFRIPLNDLATVYRLQHVGNRNPILESLCDRMVYNCKIPFTDKASDLVDFHTISCIATYKELTILSEMSRSVSRVLEAEPRTSTPAAAPPCINFDGVGSVMPAKAAIQESQAEA